MPLGSLVISCGIVRRASWRFPESHRFLAKVPAPRRRVRSVPAFRKMRVLIDDRRVFAGMELALVNDIAEIGAVLQHQVERENGLPPTSRPEALVHDLLLIPRASSSACNKRTEPSSA